MSGGLGHAAFVPHALGRDIMYHDRPFVYVLLRSSTKETDAEEKQRVPHESHITEFQASTTVSLCSYWMPCIYLNNNHVKICYFLLYRNRLGHEEKRISINF